MLYQKLEIISQVAYNYKPTFWCDDGAEEFDILNITFSIWFHVEFRLSFETTTEQRAYTKS